MSEKKGRNSTFELLRIISMFFIVISHYSVHAGFDMERMAFGWNKLLIQSAKLGNLGVDIFVMISGYFLVKSRYSFKKVLLLLFQVYFYSAGFYLIFMLSGREPIGLKPFLRAFLPTVFKHYWFFTAYIVLYVFSPYINRFLQNWSQKQNLALLGTMLVLWCLIPTFLYENMYGDEALQFLMFYCMGAYLRIYPEYFLSRKKLGIILVISCASLMFLSSAVLELLRDVHPLFARGVIFFYSRFSLLTVGIAFGLMILFLQMGTWHNRWINAIASCTFGVYLIHEHQSVRPFLWTTLFQNKQFGESPFLLLHMILSVVSVYVACTAIEYMRKKLLEEPFLRFLDRHDQTGRKFIQSLIEKGRKPLLKLDSLLK